MPLPREPLSRDPITNGMLTNALAGLRFDTIVSVKFDIRPSVGIVAKDIDRLGLDIRSWREPLTQAIKTVIIPSIRKNFDVGGRPPWEPLSAGTIKNRGYEAWPILKVTGTLKRRATQLNIWSIGQTSATVRTLPSDAFYGVYHQAGADGGHGGGGTLAKLQKLEPGSKEANALLAPFIKKARKEFPNASEEHIKNRVRGLIMDEDEGSWHLPARPFIGWQDGDAEKIQAIFLAWMTERAARVGRFT